MLTTPKTKILVCDADINLTMVFADYLKSRDYVVETSADGKDALDKLQSSHYDICLTDVSLPKLNGFEMLQSLRRAKNAIPVIFVTERMAREDVIKGFELGCDDYVGKPFSMDILIYRIEAIVRRYHAGVDTETLVFNIGGKCFDSVHQTFDGKHMSARESDLLLLLCRNMNKMVDRHEILGTLWKSDDHFAARSLSVYANRLRRNYIDGTGYHLIGVRSRGYKLVDE